MDELRAYRPNETVLKGVVHDKMENQKRLIDANEFVKNFWQRVHDGEIVTLMDVEHAIINAPTVNADENIIYKAAFEIAVRCARELSGTPELKEAYQEAQKNNRALRSFMDFCLQKAAEEILEQNAVEVVSVVRCKDCRWAKQYERTDGQKGFYCTFCGHAFKYGTNWERTFTPVKESEDFCSYGERKIGEVLE